MKEKSSNLEISWKSVWVIITLLILFWIGSYYSNYRILKKQGSIEVATTNTEHIEYLGLYKSISYSFKYKNKIYYGNVGKKGKLCKAVNPNNERYYVVFNPRRPKVNILLCQEKLDNSYDKSLLKKGEVSKLLKFKYMFRSELNIYSSE